MKTINTITLCIATSIALLGCNQAKVLEQPEPKQTTLQVIRLNSLEDNSTKHFSGVVRAHDSANLAFRVPGTLSEVHVQAGDSVRKGDVIARLDPHDYQVALEELEAKMLEAKSAHKLAKAELKRVKQAIADNAIASVNLDRATSGYERSLSAVKVVNKNIQRAKDTLGYTQLVAPFDGIIASVEFDAHEQVLPGIAVATMQDNSALDVEIDVPENMIDQFSINDSGSITWYQSDTPINGYVTEIAPLPHLIKQTYTVTYTLDNANQHLFSGKSVTVSSKTTVAKDAFCIPYSALVGEKEELHINVVRNNEVVSTPVELRSLDAYQACISGNVKGDDYVVVSGSFYLKDGDVADKLVLRDL